MKKLTIVLVTLTLISCASRPVINPETSINRITGENIAKNYYKDLLACKGIWEMNPKFCLWFTCEEDTMFIKKCMTDYGYSVLHMVYE